MDLAANFMWKVKTSLGKCHGFWLEHLDSSDDFQREKAAFSALRGLQSTMLGHRTVRASTSPRVTEAAALDLLSLCPLLPTAWGGGRVRKRSPWGTRAAIILLPQSTHSCRFLLISPPPPLATAAGLD